MENEDKGLFNNIIDSVISGLEKLIKLIKKHGILYTILIMVIFIVFWTLIINPIRLNNIIEERLRHQYELSQQAQADNHQELINRRYEANEIVNDIMAKILFKFKANRVLLLEKHNSVSSLGNVDFLYLSCTLELIDLNNTETDYISEDLQRQMTVNLLGNDVIGLLKHSKYLFYDDLQHYNKSQCRLLNKLKKQGEKQALIIPFCDKNHKPLLIMVICGDNLNVKEIYNYVEDYSKQITDLLIFE